MTHKPELTRRQALQGSAALGLAALGSSVAARAKGVSAASPAPPTASFVMRARFDLGEPQEIGEVGNGYRRIVPITGGSFEGPELKGTILAFGADWQLISPGGKWELDARYTLRTDRNELIYVHDVGGIYMPPSLIPDIIANRPTDSKQMHGMGACRMESGAVRLRWMNSRYFFPRERDGERPLTIDFYDLTGG